MPTPPKKTKSKRPTPGRVKLTCSLAPGMDTILKRLAAADRRSVSSLLQVMIDDGLKRRTKEAG